MWNLSSFVFVVFCLYTSSCYSQVKLSLFFKDLCNPSNNTVYTGIQLERKGKLYEPINGNINYISIPDTGSYFIVVSGAIPMPIEYKVIGGYPSILDTLVHNYIQPCALSGGEYLFCCCDEYCDGHQIDYYPSGTKKVEGIFDRGEAIGKIYTYDLDGKVRFVYQFDKLRLLKKVFFYDEDHKKKRLRGDIQFDTLKYLFLKRTIRNMYKSEL
jgi:hypothetical protein